MNTKITYALGWMGLAILGVLNGIVREYAYGPYVSELTAHRLATMILLVVTGVYIWWLTGVRPIESGKQALGIGAIWLGMTVFFEFVFGHFVAGHSWQSLLFDYNLAQGRVWLFVLGWIAVTPLWFYYIRSSTGGAEQDDDVGCGDDLEHPV